MQPMSVTENAVINISVGFDGPFILQVFSLPRTPLNWNNIQFCLTDGNVYIGARYKPGEPVEIQNFWLVRVTAEFEDRYHPIIIKSLDIVSREHRKLIGNPPCTLQDYFNKMMREGGADGHPKKKSKLNEEEATHHQTQNQFKKVYPPISSKSTARVIPNEAQKQIPQKQDSSLLKKTIISQPSVSSPPVLNLAPKKFDPTKRQLRFDSQSDNEIQEKPVSNEQQHSPSRQLSKNSMIKDLFQRHSGWVILCRVNYLSLVQCSNGLFAINFVLVDQLSYEIKCVYFAEDIDWAREVILVGNYYLFSNGEIKSTKDKELQITFDKNSFVIHQPQVNFKVNSGRITRISKIPDEEHLSQVTVLGIVRKIKTKEVFRSKNKFTATLSDPIQGYQVDFMLFLNPGEKEISVGMIIMLHNFQVFKQGNICRLNSTFKSYYFEEKGSEGIVREFQDKIKRNEWNHQSYRNISMFAFTHRTIAELKEIIKNTEDQKLFSSLDLWVMQVSKKKYYNACKICKKITESREMGMYECHNCRKMVDVILTYTLSVTFTDSTGSIIIDVLGEHAQNLLGMRSYQFSRLGNDLQNNHLECLKFKNIQMRLKTERKPDKKQSHSVWGIDSWSAEASLKEIRRRMTSNRLKFEERDWSYS